MDGMHLVVAKGYSYDVCSKLPGLALISTMYYFAISQHRHLQIPARSWKQHHPTLTSPPKADSRKTNSPSHEACVSPTAPRQEMCRILEEAGFLCITKVSHF